MIQKFFAAVGLIAVGGVLMSAATGVFQPVPAGAGTVAIDDLPFTRHFSVFVGQVGPIDALPGAPQQPFTVTMSSDAGVALAQITGITASDPVVVRVNGTDVFKGVINANPFSGSSETLHINPAIIVPPDAELRIGVESVAGFGTSPANLLTLGGYTLASAEFGQ